jgi:hypothetical protein
MHALAARAGWARHVLNTNRAGSRLRRCRWVCFCLAPGAGPGYLAGALPGGWCGGCVVGGGLRDGIERGCLGEGARERGSGTGVCGRYCQGLFVGVYIVDGEALLLVGGVGQVLALPLCFPSLGTCTGEVICAAVGQRWSQVTASFSAFECVTTACTGCRTAGSTRHTRPASARNSKRAAGLNRCPRQPMTRRTRPRRSAWARSDHHRSFPCYLPSFDPSRAGGGVLAVAAVHKRRRQKRLAEQSPPKKGLG